MNLEQLIKDLLDKQKEVLEAVTARRGQKYGDAVSVASESLAVLWHIKGREDMTQLGKYLDHASQCVLMIGCMVANSDKPRPTEQEQVKMLLEFTEDVKNCSRHMVHHVAESDLGE